MTHEHLEPDVTGALATWADSTHHYNASEIRTLSRTSKRPGFPIAAALVIFVLAVGVVLVGLAVGRDDSPAVDTPLQTSESPGFQVGQPAPAMTGTTSEGDPFDLAALRGSQVILDLTATWCVPCSQHLPGLREAATTPGVEVVSIALDDDPAAVAAQVTADGGTWPVIALDLPSLNAIGPTALPTTVVIDDNGVVREFLVGATTVPTVYEGGSTPR